MGVFTRPDSKYYWLYLEPLKKRQPTEILVKGSDAQRTRENRKLAEEVYHTEMARLAAEPYGLGEKPRIRFDAYATWYEAKILPAHRGAEREKWAVKVLVKHFGREWLHLIDTAKVREWIGTRLATPRVRHKNSKRKLQTIKPGTVNRELDVLKEMLAAAVPKYLDESPAEGLARLEVAEFDPFRLTREDEGRLLAAAMCQEDRTLLLFALDTIARLSDCVNLQRVHDHRTYVSLVRPKQKAYKVPVSERLREALDKLEDDGTGYYFSQRRRAENPRDFRGSVRTMLRRCCRIANVPYGRPHGLTFHGLRHEGATRMLEAGTDPKTVQEIGGWKDFRAMQRYLHPTSEAKRRAVDSIGGGSL